MNRLNQSTTTHPVALQTSSAETNQGTSVTQSGIVALTGDAQKAIGKILSAPTPVPSQSAALPKLEPAAGVCTDPETAARLFKTVPSKASEAQWKNPGAGFLVIYKTEAGLFTVQGRRFDLTWKSSVGGSVDENESFGVAAKREVHEETFKLLSTDRIEFLGGIHLNRTREIKNGAVKGYDYATFAGSVHISYSELEQLVCNLNRHAPRRRGSTKCIARTEPGEQRARGFVSRRV